MARFWPFLMRILLLALILISPARADLRTPAWWNNSTAPAPSTWHYRVPISVATGNAVNSTVKFDVDFNTLLATMGVSGTFDVNSPRVVRSTGALSTIQEFTDTVYASATDVTGNARGEVRFILEDAGPVTYYLYFDVTQNGVKSANPQTPIDGNFERGTTGQAQPPGWNAPTLAAITPVYDAQVRPNETYTTSTTPAPLDTPTTRTTDGSPNTGAFSYLIGNRTVGGAAAASGSAASPGATITKTITVPATNPGSITFRYRPEGWDSANFDPIAIDLTNAAGTTLLVQMVGATAGSYTTKPWAPNPGGAQVTTTAPGYRQYNGYDCGLNGTHTSGMTVACHSEPWWTVTQSLAAYAGQTIMFRVQVSSDAADKSWYHLDDIEWSVSTGTLGTPEAFGVNITAPATGTTFTTNQTITVTVQTDAVPTSATPMTIGIYSPSGTLLSGPITLYNNATNGDATANDTIWTNNAVVIPTAAAASGYIIRAFGKDLTTSTIGASAGIARGPGTGAAIETQSNFWNIDEILFNINTAALTVAKTSSVVSDPINGTTNPKMIPGATVRYCILISNAGPLAATSVVGTDPLPAAVLFTPGTIKSGTSCATATTAGGATFAGTTLTINIANLASGASQAVVFDAVVQ